MFERSSVVVHNLASGMKGSLMLHPLRLLLKQGGCRDIFMGDILCSSAVSGTGIFFASQGLSRVKVVMRS